MIITKAQMREIETLIPKHKNALIAYGADMYRQGLVKGALLTAIGVGVGTSVSYVVRLCSKHHIKKENEAE